MATVAEIQAQIDAKKAQAASMPTGPAKQALLQEIDGLLQERQNAQLQDDPNALGPSSDLAGPRVSGSYTQDMGVADATHVVNPEGTDRVSGVDVHGYDLGGPLQDLVTKNNPIAGTIRGTNDVLHGDFGSAVGDYANGWTRGAFPDSALDPLKTFDASTPTKPLSESIPGLKPAPAPAPTSPQQQPTSGTGDGSQSSQTSWGGPSYDTNLYHNWWDQNQSKYTQPTAAEQHWNAVQGQVYGGHVSPDATRGAYGQAQGYFSGGPQGAQNAQNISQRLGNQQGSGEKYAADNASYFQTPGTGEKFGQGASDYFKGPGQGEQYIGNHLGYFNSPGQGEQAANAVMPQLMKQGQGATGAYGVAGSTQDWAKQGSPINSEYGYFSPGLRDKGYTEKLYEQGNQGLNQYYERGLAKQSEALNRQMEARGLYNSGAAVRALEEAGADTTANQARDMAGLAQAADQAKLGRTGAALDFTSRGAADDIARHGMGLDAGKLGLDADASNLSRLNSAYNVGAGAQGLSQSRELAGMGAATNAQNLAEGRLGTGYNIAAGTQGLGNARVGQGYGMASGAQGLEQGRLAGSLAAGNSADQGMLNWTSGIMGAAGQRDASNLAADANTRGWFGLGQGAASAADSARLGQLDAYGSRAGDVAGNQRDLANDQFSQTFGVANAKANATIQALGGAASEKFQSAMSGLDLLMKKGQLDAEHAGAMAKDLGVDVAALIELYETYKSNDQPTEV